MTKKKKKKNADWNFGVFFFLISLFGKITFLRKEFLLCVLFLFWLSCWVSGEFSVWFHLAPLKSPLYPVFQPSAYYQHYYFFTNVWNHVPPVTHASEPTYRWMKTSSVRVGLRFWRDPVSLQCFYVCNPPMRRRQMSGCLSHSHSLRACVTWARGVRGNNCALCATQSPDCWHCSRRQRWCICEQWGQDGGLVRVPSLSVM